MLPSDTQFSEMPAYYPASNDNRTPIPGKDYPHSMLAHDESYHSAVIYRAAEDFYELAVAHRVEEAFQVKVNYIDIAFINYPLRSSQGIMAASSRTEAVASW